MPGFSVTITKTDDEYTFTCSACEWFGLVTDPSVPGRVALDHLNLFHPRDVMELSMQ